MKTNILRWSLALTAISMTTTGCLKSEDPQPPGPPQTYISVMHLAPTAPAVDVFFDNTKVSNVPFAPNSTTLAYNGVDKGVYTMKFKKAGADSLVAEVPQLLYDSLNYYTIFIYNLSANGPAQALRIEDDFSEFQADRTKLYYRFFHGSPNTGPVDIFIDDVRVASFRTPADNTTNATLNNFVATTSSANSIKVKIAGADSVIASVSNAALQVGNAYTFYLKGLDGGTGDNQLSLGILRAVD